jgi:hypothetical protein
MEMNRDASYTSAVYCNFNGVEMEECEPLRISTNVLQLTVIPGSCLTVLDALKLTRSLKFEFLTKSKTWRTRDDPSRLHLIFI